MPLIIDEILAEVVAPPDQARAHPAEGTEQDTLLDLLELAREREERLRAD
jgi:hypothetical protein